MILFISDTIEAVCFSTIPGNPRYQYDALGNQTEYVYDSLGRLTDRYDPDPDGQQGNLTRPHTVYAYDAAGEQIRLTDPGATATYLNTTAWAYDYLGRKVSETLRETSTSSHTTTFGYNILGDLTKTVKDAGTTSARELDYAYDNLHRLSSETWQSSPTRTMSYTYDIAGRMLGVTDRSGTSTAVGADYAYTYDWLGRNTATAATIVGLTSAVNTTQQFDLNGNRLQLNVKLGTTQFFQNQYRYDRLNRMTEVSQGFQSGGGQSSFYGMMLLLPPQQQYPVFNKLVAFGYDAYGRTSTISRFGDFAKTVAVAASTIGYDDASRITSIVHSGLSGGASLNYSWGYDNADRVNSFTSPDSGTATSYAYDNTSQLTGADYAYQTDESYTYDENGNRTGGTYATGAANRITTDASGNTYDYDGEGNRVRKTASNGLSKTEYGWDYRNRLASVTNYSRANQSIALDAGPDDHLFLRRLRPQGGHDGR